jgi:hypothetical protein
VRRAGLKEMCERIFKSMLPMKIKCLLDEFRGDVESGKYGFKRG